MTAFLLLRTTALLFVFGGLPIAADPTLAPSGVLDTLPDKAVAFKGTNSPDGRYAIGWTIRPKAKGTSPIDWSLYRQENPWVLIDKYNWDPEDRSASYEMLNGVIDLRLKKMINLPSDNPDHPFKNRGYLVVVWSKPGVTSYGLVQNDTRFGTCNLWLIQIADESTTVTDLVPIFDKEVGKELRKKRPVSFDDYGFFYPIASDPSDPAVFSNGKLTVPFSAEIPKSMQPSVGGHLLLNLPGKTILNVSSDTGIDDPLFNVPELAKADAELNAIYARLQHELDKSRQQALKDDQLDWIKQRNRSAAEAWEQAANANDLSPVNVRNKSLLDSTEARTSELRKRLETAP